VGRDGILRPIGNRFHLRRAGDSSRPTKDRGPF
jgi:hypothetical protein